MNPFNPPRQYLASLEDKVVHNEKFVQYKFELTDPYELEFAAGQYVSLKVSESGLRRSYSICSSPGIKHGFELLVDLEPGGVGCAYLEGLAFGDEIELLGPMGIFTIAQDHEEEIVLIATGSGISPFKSMVLDLLQEKHDNRPIHLYWGLRYIEYLFWQDEFEELVEAFDNFSFTPVLSRPPDRWPLSRGRVTDIFSLKELNTDTAGYYLCGNTSMIEDMMTLLSEKGVISKHIHHEKFF